MRRLRTELGISLIGHLAYAWQEKKRWCGELAGERAGREVGGWADARLVGLAVSV